jgi:hypothetical protein
MRPSPPRLPSDDPGLVTFEKGLIVEIARGCSGNGLDLTMGAGGMYTLSFRQRDSQIWSVELPADGTAGVLTHRVLPLPPGLRFDRIVILPGSGDGPHSLGHLIVVE